MAAVKCDLCKRKLFHIQSRPGALWKWVGHALGCKWMNVDFSDRKPATVDIADVAKAMRWLKWHVDDRYGVLPRILAAEIMRLKRDIALSNLAADAHLRMAERFAEELDARTKPRAKPAKRWSYDTDTGTLAYCDGEASRLVLGDEFPEVAELLNKHGAVLTKARRR